ncbi:MAG: NAD(P)-binding protein, partial [Burkholderiales bacterium]|nr:NAD(P)-binding protein [Burkholderiales bacterium]
MAEKKALVIGLGASGLAAAKFLHSHGWKVKVIDTRADPPALAKLRAEMPEAEFVGGNLKDIVLQDEQLGAISPGLSPFFSEAAPIV